MKDISIVTITIRPQNLAKLAQELFSQLSTFRKNVQLEHIIVLDHLTLSDQLHCDLEQQYRRAQITLTILNDNDSQEITLFEKLARMRNIGAAKAIGRYLAFWDDDNQWKPNHLSSLYQLLEEQSEYGAAHSWRQLTDANGTPALIKEDQYPWITYNDKASKEMYRLQMAEGIFEKNSSIIKDRFAYGPYLSDCCVDTGEWLIKTNVFTAIGGFKAKQSAVEKMYRYTDDQLLGLKLIANEIKVICSEEPTLIYKLGGYSQVLHKQQEQLTIMPGNFYLLALANRHLLNNVQLPKLLASTITAESLHKIKMTDRVPLSPETLSQAEAAKPWTVSSSSLDADGTLSILNSSPYAIGLTPAIITELNEKFLTIPWAKWGAIIEPRIREKFLIPTTLSCSIVVFGGILWKQEKTHDLDILVIIENPSDITVNVGSPSSSIFWPEELNAEQTLSHIDISIIGRGALLDPTKHSGDLTNICIWAHQGVCLKGNPALISINDQNLLQDIFTTLGFGFKNVLATTERADSFKKNLVLAVKTTFFLSRKYDTPLELAFNENRSAFEEKSILNINSFVGSLEDIIQKSMPWLNWINAMAKKNSEALQLRVVKFYHSIIQDLRLIGPMFIDEISRINIPSLFSIEAKRNTGELLKTAVILVSFNRSDMLIRIIPRLLSQNYHHLVIIDNASNEPLTGALLRLVNIIDPRVHVIFNTNNHHLSNARNQGIDFLQNKTTGVQLIMVMDNDIELPENTIEIASKIFNSSSEMRQISMVPALPDFPVGDVFCVAGQRLVHTLHNCTGAQSVFRAALVLEHGLRYREQTYITPHSIGEDFWFTHDSERLVRTHHLSWHSFAWFSADNPVLAKDFGRDGAYMIQYLDYYIKTFADRKTLDYLKRLIQHASISQHEIDASISKIEYYESTHGGAESLETPFSITTLFDTFASDRLVKLTDPDPIIQSSIAQLVEVMRKLADYRETLHAFEKNIFRIDWKAAEKLKQVLEESLSCFLHILSFTEKHPLFSQSIFQADMYLNRMRIYVNKSINANKVPANGYSIFPGPEKNVRTAPAITFHCATK